MSGKERGKATELDKYPQLYGQTGNGPCLLAHWEIHGVQRMFTTILQYKNAKRPLFCPLSLAC